MTDIFEPPTEWSLLPEVLPYFSREGRLKVMTKEEREESKMEWPAIMGPNALPPKKVIERTTIGKETYTWPWYANRGFETKTYATDVGCLHLPRYFPTSRPKSSKEGESSEYRPILFFNTNAVQDDYRQHLKEGVGRELLFSSAGRLFLRTLNRLEFDLKDWAFTSYHKWLPPKDDMTPPKVAWAWGRQAAEDDLNAIKPKIVVAMGKEVFQWLAGEKLPTSELHGILLPVTFNGHSFHLYYLEDLEEYLMKPEYIDNLTQDLKWLKQEFHSLEGIKVDKLEVHYDVLDTLEKVKVWLDQVRAVPGTYWSVDCEWHGMTYRDGLLRAMQVSWKPGYAVYFKFRDEQKAVNPNLPLKETGELLSQFVLERDIKYVGHNLVADLLWMKHHLGMPVENRAAFDTMFAQHTLNEYADLKLERLAHKYTDLGRYDYELWKWKRDNGYDSDEGYGTVPEEIIVPYAQRDCDAVFRIFPKLRIALQGSPEKPTRRLYRYYTDILLPFVTTGFMELMEAGLPIDQAHLDLMRSAYQQLQVKLEREFLEKVREEAIVLLRERFIELDPSPEAKAFIENWETRLSDLELNYNNEPVPSSDPDQMRLMHSIREQAKRHWPVLQPVVEHRLAGRHFNVDSTPAMRQWLFDVKRLTPIKTTKDKGIQINWDKVLLAPKERQAKYRPSTDKQTLKTLAQKDVLLSQCMEVKQVATMLKTFLRGDSTAGAKEGLHQWVCSDGKIHANFSLTETGRPRTWKPNILNWPKHVAKPIEAAFSRHLPGNIYGLRSIVAAPEGEVIVDMDLRTAEVVALAYYSGDTGLIGELTEEDVQFVRIDPNDPDKVKRIGYQPYEGVTPENQDLSLCITLDDPRIMRHPDGRLWHPMRDLHWEMATAVMKLPREKLDKNIHRAGVGKIGNFSIPYGSTAGNLERMVEASTGKKPEPETGDKMIEAYNTKRPKAAEFLQKMANIPGAGDGTDRSGIWQSISGRIRHFKFSELFTTDLLTRWDTTYLTGEIRPWVEGKITNPLTRQARNYPMQEIVAATTAKALNGFVAWKAAEAAAGQPVQSRVFMLLYDAVSLMVPLSELARVLPKVKALLTVENRWYVPDSGHTFNFDVDVGFSKRWGVKLTPKEKQEIQGFLPSGFNV